MFKEGKTNRGFSLVEFKDFNQGSCSMQKSSLATEDCLWIGLDDVKPMKLVSGKGWVEVPIDGDIEICGRMHIDREQAKNIIAYLQNFVDSGDPLPAPKRIK